MYKNKAENGDNNIIGKKLKDYRKRLGLSQNGLAKLLQLEGLDIDKNAIQRIEARKRFVTDIEIHLICKVLHVTFEELV